LFLTLERSSVGVLRVKIMPVLRPRFCPCCVLCPHLAAQHPKNATNCCACARDGRSGPPLTPPWPVAAPPGLLLHRAPAAQKISWMSNSGVISQKFPKFQIHFWSCREFTKEMHVFASKHPQRDVGVPVRPFRWLSPPGQLNLQPPACSK
jgi:hypothetical protein